VIAIADHEDPGKMLQFSILAYKKAEMWAYFILDTKYDNFLLSVIEIKLAS